MFSKPNARRVERCSSLGSFDGGGCSSSTFPILLSLVVYVAYHSSANLHGHHCDAFRDEILEELLVLRVDKARDEWSLVRHGLGTLERERAVCKTTKNLQAGAGSVNQLRYHASLFCFNKSILSQIHICSAFNSLPTTCARVPLWSGTHALIACSY